MEVPYKLNQEVICNFYQMSINVHNESEAKICINEDPSFLPPEIVELIFSSMSTFEDMGRASLVCKDGRLVSSKFFDPNIQEIFQWPYACEQWEKNILSMKCCQNKICLEK